jgi:hypothetical protein
MKDIKYVQLEPTAFLSDIDFQMMDAEQRGVFWSIILYLYANGGKIELPPNSVNTLLSNNTEVLANISNCRKMGTEWGVLWSKIAHKFQINGNILTHKRVTVELEAAKRLKDAKSRAGKLGMEKRYSDNSDTNTDITKVRKDKVSKDNINNLKNNNNIIFSAESRKLENISEQDIQDWSQAYPAVDVRLETKRAEQWCLANPTKTKKNYRRFLTNWFARTQERGGNKNERKGISRNQQQTQNQTTGSQAEKRARISEQDFSGLEMHDTSE